jgi:hypothetical protein
MGSTRGAHRAFLCSNSTYRRTVQFCGKFTRSRTAAHHQEIQQPSSFGIRHGRDGGLFETVDNVGPNGPGVRQVLEKKDAILSMSRFTNRFNPKRIRLDSDRNNELVVLEFEHFLVVGLAEDAFAFRVQGTCLGLQVSTIRAENGSDRLLNATTFQRSNRSRRESAASNRIDK